MDLKTNSAAISTNVPYLKTYANMIKTLNAKISKEVTIATVYQVMKETAQVNASTSMNAFKTIEYVQDLKIQFA